MTPADLGTALRPVLDALVHLGVRHFVTGSIASSAHGVPRASIDADVVAELDPSLAAPLITALAPNYYVPAGRVTDAILQRTSFGVIHLNTMLKIDIFVAHGEADRASLARAGLLRLDGGGDVPVCSAEDTVAAKLAWFRRGGEVSERQWRDVLGLLRVATLEIGYLRSAADVRGVTDLLDRALADAASGGW